MLNHEEYFLMLSASSGREVPRFIEKFGLLNVDMGEEKKDSKGFLKGWFALKQYTQKMSKTFGNNQCDS